jgi:hypothetical protein
MFCSTGHTDCLAYVIKHGTHVVNNIDNFLYGAVGEGHLACVDLLLAHRQSDEPYLHTERGCPDRPHTAIPSYHGPLKPHQLRCLSHILDKGCPVDTGALITAVRNGDLELVRNLHGRGVRLWTSICAEEASRQLTFWLPTYCLCNQYNAAAEGRLAIPSDPRHARHMWSALKYCAVMGAPLTPAMWQVFKRQRECTRAVLLCFHAATRLSQGEGSQDEKAAWGAMACVPSELIEKVIVLAEFEISESLRRRLWVWEKQR